MEKTTEEKPISLADKRAERDRRIAKEKEREIIKRIIKASERLPF